jgi:4-hydroxythreonine-4-phosphate dehydrogenase
MKESPWIAVTLGDPLGIGPEVTLKALKYLLESSNSDRALGKPIILYGLRTHFEHYPAVKSLADSLFLEHSVETIQSVDGVIHPRDGVPNVYFLEVPQAAKAPNPFRLAGIAAKASLKKAVDDLKANPNGSLITSPVSKERIGSVGFEYGGHTEYLAKRFDVAEVRMIMEGEAMSVLLQTIHIPLEDVRHACSAATFTTTLKILEQEHKSSSMDSALKVAMLALNPHAGDGGHISTFEEEIVSPWIKEVQKTSTTIHIEGPFAADGFFAHQQWGHYDIVWAMYHDQGLIPFKMHSASTGGINRTIGLPILRVSPDHGTADDIAGQDKANPLSMIRAFKRCLG